jgi:Fe-S-cluster-containing hydrogenase component 2
MRRKIIEIDRAKCDGCGLCVPDCPEGAIQMIDGKATLVSDLFCDGLGACLGTCPIGAITIVEREARAYDEARVMEHIVKQGPNVVKAHLMHLKEHGEDAYLAQAIETLARNGQPIPDLEVHSHHGCPGSAMRDLSGPRTGRRPAVHTPGSGAAHDSAAIPVSGPVQSELTQWPIQLHLVSPLAPYLQGADLLVAADCTAFSLGSFHQDLLKGKKLVIACPKLDETENYVEKLAEIIKINAIKSLTVAIMTVPCCGGLARMVEDAIELSGAELTPRKVVVGIDGKIAG